MLSHIFCIIFCTYDLLWKIRIHVLYHVRLLAPVERFSFNCLFFILKPLSWFCRTARPRGSRNSWARKFGLAGDPAQGQRGLRGPRNKTCAQNPAAARSAGAKFNLVAKILVLCKTIDATQPPARSTPCESRDAPEDDDSADPRGHAEQTRAEEERGLHCMETADADDQSF